VPIHFFSYAYILLAGGQEQFPRVKQPCCPHNCVVKGTSSSSSPKHFLLFQYFGQSGKSLLGTKVPKLLPSTTQTTTA
jgi:hypothetical protein